MLIPAAKMAKWMRILIWSSRWADAREYSRSGSGCKLHCSRFDIPASAFPPLADGKTTSIWKVLTYPADSHFVFSQG
jgi:hypothetical protein